jgi:hypothetical protein
MQYLTDLKTLGGLGQGLAFVAVKAPSPVLLPWSDKVNLERPRISHQIRLTNIKSLGAFD